jgi:xanthine/uracil permease
MHLRYDLNDVPPVRENLLFGLQWLAISIPGIVILGNIVGVLHFSEPLDRIIYLQKLCFVTGITLFCQVLWGHRLPLITGPSAVLLIGVIASRNVSLGTIYGSIAIGGAALFLVSIMGLFGLIRRLFTPRVVASLLLLIAFTLTPTIIKLLATDNAGGSVPGHLSFSMAVVIVMFLLFRRLKGIWKSTVIIWSMAGASIAYFLIFRTGPDAMRGAGPALLSPFFHHLTTGLSLDWGVLISFFFCFFALSVNDVSSIQSISEMLKPDDPKARLNRGLAVTGLSNVLSGLLGVMGLVNFSLSPGVIMASGCASRFTLVPAAVGLTALSFSPFIVGFIGSVPPVVIGTMLIYILCYQVAAGFMVALGPGREFSLESGLVIGLPLLAGIIFSFLPADAIRTFPGLLRPLIGNGFVIGVLASLLLEHVIFPESSQMA